MKSQCSVCDKIFCGASSLKKHISQKQKLFIYTANDYSCPYCTYYAKKKYNLQHHIEGQHPDCKNVANTVELFCEACDFGCNAYDELITHYQTAHDLCIRLQISIFQRRPILK